MSANNLDHVMRRIEAAVRGAVEAEVDAAGLALQQVEIRRFGRVFHLDLELDVPAEWTGQR